MSRANLQSLRPEEVRVLGCLIEKQRTTPDVYPLSLNALRLACNQSTNRDPVVDYDEETIRDAVRRLERRGLVRLASGAGSRAAKYRHLLADALPLPTGEQAILCVLMLRGPQTPGELKQRAERMSAFASLAEVQRDLDGLIARELAVRLERRPGQKEVRYAQLLGEDAAQSGPPADRRASPGEPGLAPARAIEPPALNGSAQPLEARVERLEREVARLQGLIEQPAAAPVEGTELR
jgi:uncharacterized protein